MYVDVCHHPAESRLETTSHRELYDQYLTHYSINYSCACKMSEMEKLEDVYFIWITRESSFQCRLQLFSPVCDLNSALCVLGRMNELCSDGENRLRDWKQSDLQVNLWDMWNHNAARCPCFVTKHVDGEERKLWLPLELFFLIETPLWWIALMRLLHFNAPDIKCNSIWNGSSSICNRRCSQAAAVYWSLGGYKFTVDTNKCRNNESVLCLVYLRTSS